LVVVLSLRIVGGLLISALLVIPVIAASRFSQSFGQTILLATFFAVIAVIVGLFMAFYVGIAAGGAIVVAALIIFLLALLLGK
jgi:zinc transport system permease protein